MKKRYFIELVKVRDERVVYKGLVWTTSMPRLVEELAYKGYMVTTYYEWAIGCQPKIIQLGEIK